MPLPLPVTSMSTEAPPRQPDRRQMGLQLDENVPLPLLSPLRHLLPAHEVDHVERIGWKGKKDSAQLDSGLGLRTSWDGFHTHASGQAGRAPWVQLP